MNRPDQPLDLDAIEARVAEVTGGPWRHLSDVVEDGRSQYVTSAVGSTVALVGYGPTGGSAAIDAAFIAAARTDVPALIAEVKRLRGVLGDCGDCEPMPHPDPLDENDHRDRVQVDGDGLVRCDDGKWHSRWLGGIGHPRGGHCGGATLAKWNRSYGPLTFADDPRTPREATSGTETALRRAALAEVAEQAHRLSQAICDLLDGDPNG